MKKIYLLLLAALMTCLPLSTKAAEETVFDDATTTYASQVPFYPSYGDTEGTKSQMIFPKEYLTNLSGNNLTALRFYGSSNFAWGSGSKAGTVPTLTIRLKEVDETSLSGFLSDLTTVYTGQPEKGTKELYMEFDDVFPYSGEHNLLVEVEVTTAGGYQTGGGFINKLVEGGLSYYHYSSTNASSGALPKTTFTYESGAPVTCPKPTDLTQDALSGTAVSYSWTRGGDETEWQYICLPAADAVDWEDAAVVTTTSASAAIDNLEPLTSYKFYVRAKCSAEDQSNEVSAAFKTPCAALSAVGYTEGFESFAPGNYTETGLQCWDELNLAHGSSYSYPQVYVNTNSSYIKSGNHSLYFVSGGTYAYVILPPFEGSLNGLQVTFSHKEESASNSGYITLGYMTDVTDANTFVVLNKCSRSTGWQEEVVNLAGLPDGARLAFSYGGGSNNYYAGIDDISIAAAPSCLKPATLTAEATPDGAVLNWTGDEDTRYQWCVVEKDAEATGWELLDANVFTKTITGLTTGTAYDVYVRQYCSESDWSEALQATFTPAVNAPANVHTTALEAHSATIAWDEVAGISRYQYLCVAKDGEADWEGAVLISETGVALSELTAATGYDFYVRSYFSESAQSSATKYSFTTDCDTYSLPFAENFDAEAIPNCWAVNNSSNGKWAVYTYTDESYSGYSMRFAGKSSNSATLQSPAVELSDKALLRFQWKNSSGLSTTMQISKDGGANKEPLSCNLSTAQTKYAEQVVDLSAYAGETIILYWVATAPSGSSQRYAYIDALTISIKPVAAPTDLAVEPASGSATVTWVSEEGPWALRYREIGAEDWTVVTDLAETTKTLEGLTNGTTYEVQVQATPTANRQSDWTEPVEFTPEACASVETVTFGDATYNSVEVSWTTSGAGTWDLRYRAGTGEWTTLSSLDALSHTLTGLTTLAAYTVQVKASCGDEWIAADGTFTPVYSQPATAGVADATDATAVASWAAVADAPDGYQYIVAAKDAAPDWTEAEATTELTAQLTGLEALTEYDFYVAAVYGANRGEATKSSFQTIAITPRNLQQEGEATTSAATFTWEAQGTATRWQWSLDNTVWSEPLTELTATADELEAGTVYTFYVRSYYNETAQSEAISLPFHTACAAAELPFEETFESEGKPLCWESEAWSETAAAGKWTRDNSYAHSGYALRFGAKFTGSAAISSPAILLDKQATLTFYLRNSYGNPANYISGRVVVADMENDENKIETSFGNYSADNLTMQTVELAALEGRTVVVTFEVTGVGTGVSGNPALYIDEVAVQAVPEDPTAVENVRSDVQWTKVLRDGQLYLMYEGTMYDVRGAVVK